MTTCTNALSVKQIHQKWQSAWSAVLILLVLVVGAWAGDATVPVPVTGPLTVTGATVTLPGEVTPSGDLIMEHTVKSVLLPGTIIRKDGKLRIRAVSAPVVTTQPASTTVTVPQTATFTVVASGYPTPTYQWRKAGVPIAGATSASYTTPATVAGDNGAAFSVVVTNSAGTATSANATLTVQYAPTITTQPVSIVVTSGQTATFTVATTGNPAPTYQWRRGGVPIAGATAASYTTAATVAGDNGAVFSVVATNSKGSVTSANASLTVQWAPTITTQPANTTVTLGQTATFSVVTTGNPAPTYQWRRGGVPIAGATGTSYTTAATVAGDNGAVFSVVATNSKGSVTSANATLTVNRLPAITTQPANASVAIGQTATFSVVANGNPAPTYQWRKGGVNIAGATAASYTTPATLAGDNGAQFSVSVSNSVGSVVSINASLTASAPPTVASPVSYNLIPSGPWPVTGVNLSVLGQDDGLESNLRYTWSSPGAPIGSVTFSENETNGAKATTATFHGPGTYPFQVQITDAGGLSVTANCPEIFNITRDVVRIDCTPTSTVVGVGRTAQFEAIYWDQFGSVMASPTTNPWAANGGTIDAYGLFTAGTTAGQFNVTISWPGGKYHPTVNPAIVTIVAIPTANAQSISLLEDTPTPITLSGSTTSGNPLTYAITVQPTKGTLTGTAPNLTYVPSPNSNGTDSFQFTVNDTLVTSDPVTVPITITAVNDAPSFAAGTNVSIPDTAGAQTIPGWATGMSPGPADEVGQTLSFACSGYDTTRFSVQPAISATTGTLTFTPKPGIAGDTTISVRLQDNGGTANGGQDTSAIQTFTITIQDTIWATLPAHTIYLVASETVYPDDINQVTTQLTTSYAYQWHPGTNQIARKQVNLPAVTTGTNGPGSASTLIETYDLQGRTIWSKDAEDYVHYRAYDAFSGALTLSITDVDTNRTQDFTSAPPFTTPATNPVAGGLHLKTVIVPDLLGRPVQVTDANGSVTCTVYKDAAHEVRVYPGWTGATTTGPTRVAREDWAQNYRETLTMSAMPDLLGSLPTGAEAIGSLQSLVRERLDGNGRVAFQDTYVVSGQAYNTSPTIGSQRTAANLAGTYETTRLEYTSRGFLRRTTRADGTAEHTVTDFLGRPTATWKGTALPRDGSQLPLDPTADATGCALIADYVYDGGGSGLGLLTQQRTYGDHPTTSGRSIYTTQHRYDGRGRRIRSFGPDLQMTEQVLDNFGRAKEVNVYAAVTQAEFAGTVPLAKRRSCAKALFDANGRTYSTQAFKVDSTTGVLGNSLTTLAWFDRRGNTIKSQTGASAFAKTRYDGAGRAIDSWIGIDAAVEDWSAARNASGDTVAERTRRYPDAVGNILASVRYLRRDDTAITGQLGLPADSHLSVQAAWFDVANRPVGTADFGRDNGSTRYVIDASGNLIGSNGIPSVAMPSPNSSDDYRVTRTHYDLAGRPYRRIDNLNRVSETLFDLAGRPTQVAANRDATTNPVTVGASDTDVNQKTTFESAVGGGIAAQHVIVATGTGTVDQITRYLRADPIDAGLVTNTIYPDSTDTVAGGTNQVTRTFDRLGRVRSQTDQKRATADTLGVVHEYAYDAAGRLFLDRFTNATLPTGVDGTVRRIQYGYDERGRASSIASYDQAGGALTVVNGHATGVTTVGNVLNEVKRAWDDWGNLISTAQAHEGAVTGSSPTVGYTWDDGAVSTVARSIRATGVTYPTASYGVTYAYPTAGTYATAGIGAALDRPDTIKMGSTDIATAQYLGTGTLARMVLVRAGSATVERSLAGAADGYDRFWSTAKHAWVASSTQLDGSTVRYDRGGRVVTRWASWNTTRADRDEVATYDQLDRLKTYVRAQADAAGAVTGTSKRDWSWTLDHAGNWRSFTSDADGGGATAALVQTRSHNLVNEIDVDDDHANAAGNSIASSSTPADLNWSDPTYNAVGAMTSIPKPGAETTARTLIWDAWGRLVEAKDSGATVWTGRYDGQHRLIRTTAGGVIRDSYLDEQGREVEVRTGGGAGTLAELYVWARSGDRLLRAATVAVGVPTWRAVLCDQQGSVTALVTDGSSTVVERYRYDAYGVRTVTDATGAPLAQPTVSNYGMRYAYTGRPFDAVTGLGYYRARWYHPSLGRFISRDPAGYIDGGNLYAYVRGNPLWWTDPYGLSPSIGSQISDAGIGAGKMATNFDLLKNSWNLGMTADPTTLRGWMESAAAAGGLMAGVVDAGFNFATGGGKKVVLDGGARLTAKIVEEAAEVAEKAFVQQPTRNVLTDLKAAELAPGGVNYGQLDALGRPTGIQASLTAEVIGSGSPAASRIIPPGFAGGAAGQARGHLLGNQLGGSGTCPNNLVTLLQNPTNTPLMSAIEGQARAAAEGGSILSYGVTPIYKGSNLAPAAVTIKYEGTGGQSVYITILNPPGR